jgi:protein-ribulosamine 3-kinase
MLYNLRYNLHAAALFPEVKSFRELAIGEMKKMVAKFPGGLADYEEK